MPREYRGRDDLTIDATFKNMPNSEHTDCATVLDEFMNRTANLPNEVVFMQEEIAAKDAQMNECLKIITKNDESIQKWIRINGSHVANPREEHCRKVISENFDKAELLQAEKLALTQKTQNILDKHTAWLDQHIKSLQDRHEFPNDPDLPSLLRPQVHDRIARVESTAAPMPLSQIPNSANVHPRHPNQHPARVLPPQIQAHHLTSASASSAPTTPAASLLMHRQVRESSLGAASNKRQRLTGGLGTLPVNSSSLARHSSLTPNTPRAGTPAAGARAGSAGPRVAQKTMAGHKKVAPNGSRQSGVPRKAKPGKSNLSRIKRTGNKNSPSSTNDSELSEADSGSVDEDDEAVTPPPVRDGEGDEDMADVEDDEGGDDRKYCTCQNVSFGDMVACDNDSCPYEWFHWTCVGLKSEPVGTWICPVCTTNMKSNKK